MTEGKRWPTWQEACQRHADYYIPLLMNPDKSPKDLYLDLGQINLAFKRVRDEEVGSNYHPTMIDMKLRQIAGSFIDLNLPKLFDGTATEKDASAISVSIDSVRLGYEYPVGVEALEKKYKDIYGVSPDTFFKGKDKLSDQE